jgi:threonine/homoserine/homoserine lactone efflux protein
MKRNIKILTVLSFIVVALTSIPLFVAYLKGVPVKYPIIVDLHVWAGVVFIIFAGLRIIRTRLQNKNKIF